jgi:hypothetical protein
LKNYSDNQDTVEFSGANRPYYDGKVKLGKKLSILDINPHLKRQIAYRGMGRINLIAQWDNIIGRIYAEHSLPVAIKNISNIKTLVCKVRYTRIIEFQHQKTEFIKQINVFAGFDLIADIQFVRVDKLPPKRKIPVPSGLKIPDTPHQKLSETSVQCQNTDLKKAFHSLAHIIMPHSENKQTPPASIKNENLLTSWRNRAKNILNC